MTTRVLASVRIALVVGLLAAFAVPGVAAAQGTEAAPPVLVAFMTGAAEVPGPGDADGVGLAAVIGFPNLRAVCFRIFVRDITLPATLAHIHDGATGVSGPPVVTLTPPDATGMSSGCVRDVDTALIADINANPAEYYVNVHNADFPAGAVRGQLMTIP
jgi:hypothetical protein